MVGGVAGGMSAAARLRRRDESASIVVLERGAYVSFANCGLPYHVSGEIDNEQSLLLQTPQSLAASLNLDVRINHDVIALDPTTHQVTVATPDGQENLTYDSLILSPGAQAARPPIEGLNHPRVTTLRTIDDARTLAAHASTAETAVVLGAGFIGLEAAEALAHRGLKVTVVEYAAHVLPPLEKELAWLLAEEMRHLGIAVHESTAAIMITDNAGTPVVHLNTEEEVQADIVVLAAGTTPDTRVFEDAGLACTRGYIVVDEHGTTNLPDVYAVGDATLSKNLVTNLRHPVQLAGPTNRAGRLVADHLAGGPARPIPATLGTAIVRMGRLTAAVTGANRGVLDEVGRAYTTIHIHPSDHAGYFPGATQMHLVVHIDPTTGEILGAQGVGGNGLDKRIDILATAIKAGLKAPDLIDLDLCYSPPYGSAKDPVTMIGFIADNVLTGQTKLWHPEQLDWARREAFVLDVRTPTEYATGHLPESVNIAHTALRSRLEEVRTLAAGRPIAVMCQSGVRSYIAHRILVAAGLESQTLSGGMLTLKAWLGNTATTVLVS